jgi:hypothetical protein
MVPRLVVAHRRAFQKALRQQKTIKIIKLSATIMLATLSGLSSPDRLKFLWTSDPSNQDVSHMTIEKK